MQHSYFTNFRRPKLHVPCRCMALEGRWGEKETAILKPVWSVFDTCTVAYYTLDRRSASSKSFGRGLPVTLDSHF